MSHIRIKFIETTTSYFDVPLDDFNGQGDVTDYAHEYAETHGIDIHRYSEITDAKSVVCDKVPDVFTLATELYRDHLIAGFNSLSRYSVRLDLNVVTYLVVEITLADGGEFNYLLSVTAYTATDSQSSRRDKPIDTLDDASAELREFIQLTEFQSLVS